VEQWAEIRRMHFVERLSIKEIHLAAPVAIGRRFVARLAATSRLVTGGRRGPRSITSRS
jgi:hypothetical protein